MSITRNAWIAVALSAAGLITPLLAGCGHSHHETKGGNSTMSPIAKTVNESGFKEDKKAEKHGE